MSATTESKPRAIFGTPGSHIRVILGETGSDYLLILNEDDGNKEWQTVDWHGNIPCALATQINNCISKGRYVKEVDFNTTTGAWFVRGIKRDGTGDYSWWGSTLASNNFKSSSDQKVSFGTIQSDDYPYEEEETYVVINGRNGFANSNNLPEDLAKRIQGINSRNKAIKCIRLFDDGGYFICDDEGRQWNGLGEPHGKELKNGSDTECDVAKAKDGSWIVIRDNHPVISTGISPQLTQKLNSFYSQQRLRKETREREISAYVARVHQAEQERLAREQAERERAERQAREEQERHAREADERERLLREESLAREEEERERLAREETKRAEEEERERLELQELQEQCKEIEVLEKLVNRRKREVSSCLDSLPPVRRARIIVEWRTSPPKAECVICHDGEVERALIPCGHHCLCDGCSTHLMSLAQNCPLCREPVQSTLKIYSHS